MGENVQWHAVSGLVSGRGMFGHDMLFSFIMIQKLGETAFQFHSVSLFRKVFRRATLAFCN